MRKARHLVAMSLLPLLCLLKLPVLHAVITEGGTVQTMEVRASGQVMRRQSIKQDLSEEIGDKLFSTAEIQCDNTLDTNTSKNVVLGVTPTVTSQCGRPRRHKRFLTDGETRVNNNQNKRYWRSCGNDNAPAATLSFNETCVRQIRIWSRPDCCGSQSAGVLAKVWDGEAWQQCGEAFTNVGTQAAFTFHCGIKGSKLKLTRAEDSSGIISISEVRLYPGVQPPFCMPGDIDTGSNLALERTPSVTSDCSQISGSSKAFMTDGELPSNKKKYWRSCKENNPAATVTFAESSCVRQVKIWARNQGYGTGAGIQAMVLRGSNWTQCGSDAPAIGKGETHTFECNLIGTKIRLKRECNSCRMHIREMKVFSNQAA